MDEFHPSAEELAKKGFGKDDIVNIFQAQLKLKSRQYYQKQHNMKPIGDVLKSFNELIPKADSKAESIFYNMLIHGTENSGSSHITKIVKK